MAASAGNNVAGRGKTVPEILALAFGAVYLLVGIVGFFITGFDDFFGHTDETLLVFDINPAHNVVHILIGVAGLVLGRTLTGARTYGWLLAVGYGAAFLYGLFAQFALKNMDVRALVDELRERMADELDYRSEAAHQQEFADRFAGHPFVRIPSVVPERSSRRVLTSEWVDGLRWDDFLASADGAAKQRAAEVIFRFAQGSIQHFRVFNGDPHPGNYRFHPDGTVTFLDFGLVKRWGPGELELLMPALDAILAGDVEATVAAAVASGFLAKDHGLDPERIYEYVSSPYVPYLTERFTFTREWVSETLAKVIDITGERGDVIRSLNMPTSYVVLDRVVWGVSGMLGRLGAENCWRAILAEYRKGAAPSTELGEMEAVWRNSVRPAP